MKKESYNFIKRILYMIGCLLSLILILGLMGYMFIKDNKKVQVQNIDTDTYEFCEYDKDENIVLGYELKQKEFIYPVVIIKTNEFIKDIFLEDKKLEVNEKKNPATLKAYYTISLPDDYNGKILKLKFDTGKIKSIKNTKKLKSAKNIETNKLIKEITIMSESDLVIHQIRSNNNAFILSVFFIILGIVIVVIYMIVTKKTQRIKKLFWTGVTFILISLSIMAEFGIIELVINSNLFITNLKFTGIFLCIPTVLMIAYNTFKNKKYKKIMYIYNIVLYGMYVVMRVLNYLSVITYDNMKIITIVMACVTLILLLIYNIGSYAKVNIQEKIYTVGISVWYIECFVAIMYSYFLPNVWEKYSMIYITVGVATLFLVTVIYNAFIVESYVNNITEKKMLYSLAYTDPLTGIMNRAKYDEIVEDLKKSKSLDKTVIMCDLNNLKKINDTIGHEAGDGYITSFATAISEVFTDYHFLGRIGGDEFVIILHKMIDIEACMKNIDTMFKELVKEEKYGYEASFAYGYAVAKEEKLEINDLIELADKRMYSFKEQQKLNEIG